MDKNRTAALIAGLSIYLFIGLIYAWSIFVAPLEQEFGWTRAQTALTFTVSMSFFCIGGIVSGYISKKKTSRFIVRLAAAILLAGFVMASRINTVLGLYLTYGIFCGLGVGLAYNITISTVVKWFPEKVGFISGLMMMCFGFGGMLLGSVSSAMVSSVGWRVTFIMLGFIFFILLLICSHWIVRPEKGHFTNDTVRKTEFNSVEEISVKTRDMIKRKQFWFYFMWTTLLTASGLAVIGHSASAAIDIGAAATIGTLTSGIISISNGAGRIIFGTVYDKLGRKVSMMTDNIAMLFSFALMIYATSFNNIFTFLAGAVLLGISFGGVPPTNSAFVSESYGKENYALNFSIMNIAIIPASVLGPLAAGIMRTASGSYTSVFVLLFCLCAVSIGLQIIINKPIDNSRQENKQINI